MVARAIHRLELEQAPSTRPPPPLMPEPFMLYCKLAYHTEVAISSKFKACTYKHVTFKLLS